MAAYCTTADLLLGDIPVANRTGLDAAKFVQDAADEIDSKIGFRYATPVNIATGTTTPRPVLLLLKRLNAHLASGRLVMAADAAGQRTDLHAYGASLVAEATKALDAIAAGTVELQDTALLVEPDPTPEHAGGPLIFNVDPVSQVESFYGAVTSLPGARLPSPFTGR